MTSYVLLSTGTFDRHSILKNYETLELSFIALFFGYA